MSFLRRSTVKRDEIRRLHVGAGGVRLKGWWNIDLNGAPGLDQVLDVRQGLPFTNLSFIYAEHFIEHLTLDEGLAFLAECRRILAPTGVLRLSTPNLDWVVLTHYHASQTRGSSEAVRDCLMMNRAFHSWGHRFLFNQDMLAVCLGSAGFAELEFHRYGESRREELRNLERHETYPDAPDLPHLVIVEASGQQPAQALVEPLFAEYRAAL